MALEKINSWYEYSANRPIFFPPRSLQTREADVVVLGGGCTGLLAALTLHQAGQKVLVLEQHYVGWGASGRNGGHVIAGFSCTLDSIIKLVGRELAQTLFHLSVEAMDLLKSLAHRFNLDCGFRQGYLHAADKISHLAYLKHLVQQYDEFGYEADYKIIPQKEVRNYIDTPLYYGLLRDSRSGQIHPLNFILGLRDSLLSLGIEIYEQCPVLDYENNNGKITVTTHSSKITCNKLILAGNAYLTGINPKLESYFIPVGTYIGVTEPIPDTIFDKLIPGAESVSDLNFILDYYKTTPDKRMLYGGRISYSGVEGTGIAKGIKARMVRTFPQLEPFEMEFTWSGKVAITMNRAPFLGQPEKNIYCALGYSGHGVALSLLAGKLIGQAILGDSKNLELFSKIKHRSFPGGRHMRQPLLMLAAMYYRLRDALA